MDRLAAMETFVRVIEAGSFSTAALGLNVGQPAVSKSVAQLEERLGVRLLMRSPRGLTPTEAGQKFYEHAKLTLEEADEAETQARGAAASLTGPLRVWAAVTLARLHIVPHLPAFLAAHPGLTMDVMLDDRLVDLLEYGIDVALWVGELGDSGMTARRLATAPRFVVGAPDYFERCGEPTTPAELADHEAVVYAHGIGGASWRFQRGGTEVSVCLSGRVKVSAAEGVRAAVLAGIGLSVGSELMFGPELASGALRPVLTDWTLPPLDLWAIYPTGRMASAKARAFAAFIEAELSGANLSPPGGEGLR